MFDFNVRAYVYTAVVGKYISIEHAVEQTKDAYYRELSASAVGWNEGRHDYVPFVRYLLEVILTTYQEFDERTQIFDSRGLSMGGRLTKGQRVEKLFADTLGPLSKADIVTGLPYISITTVERTAQRAVGRREDHQTRQGQGGPVHRQ